jgi:hypothetical protein
VLSFFFSRVMLTVNLTRLTILRMYPKAIICQIRNSERRYPYGKWITTGGNTYYLSETGQRPEIRIVSPTELN